MGTLAFWQLGARSDGEVLARLGALVGLSRQLTAELVAHLGEVEERRLHLRAAFGSMFQYCTTQLGLSEDEACRRIDVARLARRFPDLFPALASGALSLSVAALLKPHLSEGNSALLLERLSGKSVRQAQECLAGLFPRPDVPSSVRKLPERGGAVGSVGVGAPVPAGAAVERGGFQVERGDVGAPIQDDMVVGVPTAVAVGQQYVSSASAVGQPDVSGMPTVGQRDVSSAPAVGQPDVSSAPFDADRSAGRVSRPGPVGREARFEPLSVGRYRVQFTASSQLKEKLELARDLLRHANPGGDWALIVERAVDLLLDQLVQRRFGVKKRRGRTSDSAEAGSESACAEARRRASPTCAQATQQASPTRRQASAPRAETDGDRAPTPIPGEPPVVAVQPEYPPMSREPSGTSNSDGPTDTVSRSAGVVQNERCPSTPPAQAVVVRPRKRISSAVRRAVIERDGLGCSYLDTDGHRCNSLAWLEYDHGKPHGTGGSSDADNMRLRCRAHNGLTAEVAYGRAHVERAVVRARQHAKGEPWSVRDVRRPGWARGWQRTGGGSAMPRMGMTREG